MGKSKNQKAMPKWEQPHVRKTITYPTIPNLDPEGMCKGETKVLHPGKKAR